MLFFLFLLYSLAYSQKYLIGNQGESCYSACLRQSLTCDGSILTGNSTKLFQQLGISCVGLGKPWWANDQPSYVSDQNDPSFGKCLGYINVPGQVWCGGSYPTTRRLCHCSAPTAENLFFGTGYSGGSVQSEETDIFTHVLTTGHTGVMTHFWLTGMEETMSVTRIRFYIDGETTPSISFLPPLACGVGFDDSQSPWGTQWFGKGAKDGAWYLNFKIPFQKTVRVTTQTIDGSSHGGFYIIVRGVQDLPIVIDGLTIPSKSKLVLQVFNQTVPPLAYVPVADFPTGSGYFFMHTLSVQSGNLNFLEGCYHAYAPYKSAYPGIVLSTGTEDYFDSAWYFNAGEFHMENAGFTHIQQSTNVTFSAYRFHFKDPLPFNNGLKILWRNGDTLNPSTGLKCYEENGGITVGTPTNSNVIIYSWTYINL